MTRVESMGCWVKLAIAVAALLALRPAPAAAQQAETATDEPAPGNAADGQALTRRIAAMRAAGTACYRRRDYACALQHFEAALALQPSAEMRFNVASAQDKLGLATLAVRQYRVYLKQAAARAPSRVLRHIRRRLDRLLTRVGRIRITLSPPAARVTLNGTPVDASWSEIGAGLHELVVDPGTHRIEIDAPGYRAARQTVSLRPGALRELQVALARPAGRGVLELYSEPSGAQIWLDGQPTGQRTPAVIEVDPGRHELRLANDTLRFQREVEATAGQARAIHGKLTAPFAEVEVRSDPPGATITVDGRRRGATPALLAPLAAGTHRLVLRRAGCAPYRQRLAITVESPPRIEVGARLRCEGTEVSDPAPATPRRTMARPIVVHDLPVVGAVLGDRLELFFDFASGDVDVYALGIDAHVYLFDRLDLGLNLPLLVHGAWSGPGQAPAEETHLGNLELRAAVRLFGAAHAALAGVAYLNTRLPTTSWDAPDRGYFNLRPGMALGYQRGRLTLGGDSALQWAYRDGVEDALLYLVDVYAGLQLHRVIALQLAAQAAVLLKPSIDQPAVALMPALVGFPLPRLSVALGLRVALSEAGKLYARGTRALLLVSSGYDF